MALRILVVDDDTALAEMIGLVLEADGFEVELCEDGSRALAAFRDVRPDLILLDLMLPGLDGIQVCRLIRAESDVPIIMLTARSDTPDVVEGLEAGADDYVPKPFKPQELVARIKTRLQRVEAVPSEELQIGDLTIDVAGHEVRRGSEVIPLTPLEFDLLVALARKPRQVFSREVLLEQVWGYRHAADTRLVNVHVQRLRAKIEKDPDKPEVVVTVRGVGYRAGHPPRREDGADHRPALLQRLRRKFGRLGERLRRSLSLKVAMGTAASVTVALAVMGWYVSSEIRQGLFETRVEQMLGDAAYRVRSAQSDLDSANASTVAQVQSTAADVVRSLQEPSSGIVGAMLLRSPDETSSTSIFEPITNAALRTLPSGELRESVGVGGDLNWQSVAVPSPAGDVPGVVIGTEVNVPLAGVHELYLVYTLSPEQQTIDLMMRVLAIGAALLALLIAISVWSIMWRVLRPVRQAALTAERLAAGILDERMAVHGQDELATMARSFNEMADSLRAQITQLEELSRLQQRFVSDVSHELRTPLTTIRMASEMLFQARSQFDPVTRRSAELLQAQLDRFESMLADLLEISRHDARAATLSAEEQDLRPIVHRVVELASPLAERKGTQVRLSGFDLPVTAQVDDRRVERILRNLVLNAIEHSNGNPVDVMLADNETAAAVRVVDRGVGMSPAVAAHVFDRFWRADPARARTTGGTGLGLAISLEDARLHGGTLEAWGEEGVVAAFLLCLPKRVGGAFTPPISVVPHGLAHVPVPAPVGEP